MKKLFILSIFFSLIFLSCNDDQEPEPEIIRAYCYLYHFIPEIGSVIWDVDEVEVPTEKVYAYQFPQGRSPLNQTLKRLFLPLNTRGPRRYWQAKFFSSKRINIIMSLPAGQKMIPPFLFRKLKPASPRQEKSSFRSFILLPVKTLSMYTWVTPPWKKEWSPIWII
mgnify:CR=1 FL=1